MSKITITRNDHCAIIKGEPEVVRSTLFAIANAVWPGWYESGHGKKIYLGYADSCVDGELTVHRHGFFDVAWDNVKSHLEVDGVEIQEI